ncbi:MAG: hypothetical protein H6Q00_909 [Holophagaceae bacterium]|nr:hypothetical protein [Holophagaceae bacterium]
MPIICPGFTPGRLGRMTPARFDRRVHYLASEHDRDGVVLSGPDGSALPVEEAIGVLGAQAEYFEIIIAPSRAECAVVEARQPGSPQTSALEAGHRVAKSCSKGRPYLLALHEQDGRFHFHLAIGGTQPEGVLGPHGEVQRAWDREFFRREGQIQDWEAHRRFLARRDELRALIQRQQAHERARREAAREAAPAKKSEMGRSFELKSRDWIEQRYLLELSTIEARYEARGGAGSPEHRVEQERAEFRRTSALRRLDRREQHRQMQEVKVRLSQSIGASGREASRVVGGVGKVSRTAVDAALREMGVPRPVRTGARVTVTLASASAQVAIKTAMEAAKTAARAGLHGVRGSASLAAALVAAPFTGGASLGEGLRQAGQELAMASREAAWGGMQTAKYAVQGVARLGEQAAREVIPFQLRAVSAAIGGDPTRLVTQALPPELRRALQVIGIIPASPLSLALCLASDLGRVVQPRTRGLEVDR